MGLGTKRANKQPTALDIAHNELFKIKNRTIRKLKGKIKVLQSQVDTLKAREEEINAKYELHSENQRLNRTISQIYDLLNGRGIVIGKRKPSSLQLAMLKRLREIKPQCEPGVYDKLVQHTHELLRDENI